MLFTRRHSRPLVTAAIMAAMFMVAVEATIVSTAMPKIVADLGGLRLYSWVFSSFLLAQTATTVVFGKLADLYGRKPVMQLGIAFFLVGSLGAGFATSMTAMIAFRVVQGIGAGAIQPVSLTIVADLYPGNQRGKVQGYLASVWAISAVVGPIVGGLIIHYFTWAWIFWLNVPVGLAAALGFEAFLRENVERKRQKVDAAGAALFTLAVSSLLIGLSTVGSEPLQSRLAFAIFVVSAVLFWFQERRAVDPMMSFALWSSRPIALCNAASGVATMALMGLTTFLPMFVQGVMHRSPVVAGLTLTTMLVGWPAGATLSARLFQRLGLRSILVAGSLFVPLGAIGFVFLTPDSSIVLPAFGSLVMGFGMGLMSVSALILIQGIVDWPQRAGVTASNLFARNLGSTLGATVLGAVLDSGLTHAGRLHPISSDQLRRLLDAANPGAVDTGVQAVLNTSLHLTFLAMLLISVGVALLAVLVPATAAQSLVEEPAE